jgi:RND family efflux transporter MFP subunit
LTTAQSQAESGAQVSLSSASVKQAQGAYNAALANLEKTIIRAPISGTLNTLSIKLGDYVTASQQVAVVSNNGALKVVVFVTPQDRTTLSVGGAATIEGQYPGIITKIAPAVDPTTKKIQVDIGLTGNASALTNGESVRVELSRAVARRVSGTKAISLPIAALKIEPGRTVAFSLDADNRLVAHAVTTGAIVGDKIEITSGLSPDIRILTDARGFKEGQQVTVAN